MTVMRRQEEFISIHAKQEVVYEQKEEEMHKEVQYDVHARQIGTRPINVTSSKMSVL
jgi:hypothetical protein